MSKISPIRSIIPNFGDPKAVVREYKNASGEVYKIDVLYGGINGGDSAGHGHWAAELIDGLYQVTIDRNPDKVDGGRHLIESKHATDAYNGEARLDRIRAKRGIIEELRRLNPNSPSLGKQVKDLKDRFYDCGSCGHDDNKKLEYEFNSIKGQLFNERDRIWNSNKQQKEYIIRQAESLAYSSDYSYAKTQIKSLQEQWKQAPRASKEDEDRLWEQFRRACDQIYENSKREYEERKRKQEDAKRDKEYLVQQAESLVYNSDYNYAKTQIKALQDKWKQAPRASKDDENRLWEQFRRACDRVFDNAKREYEERKRQQDNARQQKELLVQRAESLVYSTDLKSAKEQLKSLREQWKQAPRASKEDENRLWDRFQAASSKVFEKAKQEYEKSKQEYEKRQFDQQQAKNKKENIISQASNLINSSDYRSASDAMKRLSDDFYNAGNAGKDNQALKERFNAIKQQFYNAKQQAASQKKQQYRQSLQERIYQKQCALERLESAIRNKEQQLSNLYSRPEPSYNNPHRWEIAARKNDKISSLNAAISDMSSKRAAIINQISDLQSKLNSSY